jgi:hypothetical protein
MGFFRSDLHLLPRLATDWSQNNTAVDLQQVFDYCMTASEQAINWYMKARNVKRGFARIFRIFAIILTALAALLPTLGELFQNYTGIDETFPAGWSVVLLGIVGILLLLDRFLGCSTGWIRYITTELEIRQITHEFQLDWEAGRAEWGGQGPNTQQVIKMLLKCKTHLSTVDKIIRDETQAWKCEFENVLKQIDELSKARAAQSEFGALNLTMTNGEDATDGWTLSIDDGSPETCKGKTFSKKNLAPGQYQIKIEGDIGGTMKHAEKVIKVPPGGTVSESLTLE